MKRILGTRTVRWLAPSANASAKLERAALAIAEKREHMRVCFVRQRGQDQRAVN
jgi:hypothetical protein